MTPDRPADGNGNNDGDGTDQAVEVLARLFAVIESRRGADPEASYTAKLLEGGPRVIARKLGEEALETMLEGLEGDRDKLVRESADLIYHLMVMWADAGIAPEEVWRELARREGVSGLAEKAARDG
ncbi:MAG: phosphoribosyl-ATP diphosphatase [Alphaproteobacteria bacterium]